MDIPANRSPRNVIRTITTFNLVIFGLFVIPTTHRWMDRGFRALRAAHAEETVGRSLQVWLIGSTLVVTALLVWLLLQKRKAISAGVTTTPVWIEGVLVATWWLIVLAAGVYGFVLGTGG